MALIKNWNINSMFRNYILVGTEYKINTWERVIFNIGLSMICVYIADDVTE